MFHGCNKTKDSYSYSNLLNGAGSLKAILDVPSSYEFVLRLAAEKTSPRKVLVRFEMATEPKAAAENVKIDLFEDDDEFEINEEWEDRAEEKVAEQWEDDWDDDDVHDDFSQQLRKELENNIKKS
ncbi:unnamed protein product, partial [Vitis vinifera]